MHRNLIPKVALGATIAVFVYGAFRADDANQHSTFLDLLLMYPVIFLIFGTIAISARRAYFARSAPWMIASILFWPLSFVYTLVINQGSEKDEFWWQARR